MATSTIMGYQAHGAPKAKLSIRLSGYDYDRVEGLINGNIGIEGCDYTFEIDSIGSMNAVIAGSSVTSAVTGAFVVSAASGKCIRVDGLVRRCP